MEAAIFCKLAVIFVGSVLLGVILIKKNFWNVWLFAFYMGFVFLPLTALAEASGFPVVPRTLLFCVLAFWCGQLTGGSLALWLFGEYMGGPPKFRP
jgi:hypothetical protein